MAIRKDKGVFYLRETQCFRDSMVSLGRHRRQCVELLLLHMAVWPWASYVTFLNFTVVLCRREMTMPPISNEIDHTENSTWHMARLRG